MTQGVLRQLLVVVALVATIVANWLANALPLGGVTTGEVSDRFDVFFVPAGYVFSIWGLIYLGLVAYAAYQAFPAQRNNPRLAAVGYLFVLSSVANIGWLVLWHYQQFVLTMPVMVALLLLLIGIYLRLGIGRTRVPTGEKWAVRVPFSIYLGWVSVATIANATVVLTYLNWDGWGIAPEGWAVVMMVVGALLALAMVVTRGDVAYPLVIAWAFAGIGVAQADAPLVATAAWILAAVALLLAGVAFLRNRSSRRPAV